MGFTMVLLGEGPSTRVLFGSIERLKVKLQPKNIIFFAILKRIFSFLLPIWSRRNKQRLVIVMYYGSAMNVEYFNDNAIGSSVTE